MSAARYDIIIEQGSPFKLQFRWKDGDGNVINLNGFKVCIQVRPEITSKTVALDIHNQALTGENVVLQFTAAQTAAIKVDPKKLAWVERRQAQLMVYDIELTQADGQKFIILQGFARVYPQVTQC